MVKETTFFFCVTVLVAEEEMKTVYKYLQRNEYEFKVKLVALPKDMEASPLEMRKLLKDFKKGYKAEKGITNSIDIIDKHYDSVKFEQIKQELENNNITSYGYSNLKTFMSTRKFVSPFIICNFEEK